MCADHAGLAGGPRRAFTELGVGKAASNPPATVCRRGSASAESLRSSDHVSGEFSALLAAVGDQRAPRSTPQGLVRSLCPYRKTEPHPFLVANRLVRGSYVSLHSALAHHGLIPEHVPVITSLTTGRPQQRENPFGSFEYHHCPPD